MALAINPDTNGDSLSAPVYETVDANGVDLLTGRFHARSPVLSMGDIKSPSSFYFSWNGNTWLPNTPSLWIDKNWHVFVSYDGVMDEFANAVSATGPNALGWDADMSPLGHRYDYTQIKPNVGGDFFCYYTGGVSGHSWFSLCLYASRNGHTIYYYGNLPVSASYPSNTLHDNEEFGNAMVWPSSKFDPKVGFVTYLPAGAGYGGVSNGGKIKIGYPDGYAVSMSANYNNPSITLTLSNDSMPALGINQTITISTPNLSTSNSSNTYLRPKNVTQTMTDSLGRIWRYVFNNNGDMTQVITPNGVTSTLTYDGSHRVLTFSNGVSTWNYSYNFTDSSTGAGVSTATNPLGKIKTVSHLAKPGPPTTIVEDVGGLNKTTTYAYDTHDRVTSITYPEGNNRVYAYDARGNVIQVTENPKPSVGGSALVTTAQYPASCASRITCNKPTKVIDPLNQATGNGTEYEYDISKGLPDRKSTV